jgi:hypothetical protein
MGGPEHFREHQIRVAGVLNVLRIRLQDVSYIASSKSKVRARLAASNIVMRPFPVM